MDEKRGAKKQSQTAKIAQKTIAIARASRQNDALLQSRMPKRSPPPQLPPPTIDGTLRWLRVWYGILLIAIVLYVVVSERAQHQLIDMNRAFLAGLSIVAAILVGIALYVQVRVIRPALETLQAKPDAIDALASWRSASLASYVIAEAIVLFGLCLRFLGGARTLCIPFYFVGILLMLFLFPRRP